MVSCSTQNIIVRSKTEFASYIHCILRWFYTSALLIVLLFHTANPTIAQMKPPYSVGVGYEIGNTILKVGEFYGNRGERKSTFETKGVFVKFETPRRRINFSAKVFGMILEPIFQDDIVTFEDVEGQGKPSFITRKGYYYNYHERTKRFGSTGRLNFYLPNPSKDSYVLIGTGIGFGAEKTFKYEILDDEITNYSHTYGTTYGPGPEYDIIEFDTYTSSTRAFSKSIKYDRKSLITSYEIFLNFHWRFDDYVFVIMEMSTRKYLKPYLGEVRAYVLDKYNYFSLSLNVNIPRKSSNQSTSPKST
jgi:hypothetical protein